MDDKKDGKLNVKIKLLKEGAKTPKRATAGSAGYDLYAVEPAVVYHDTVTKIDLGFCTEFSRGYVALVFPRSGLSFKEKISVINTVPVIDSDFRGNWVLGLFKEMEGGEESVHGEYKIKAGDRIAQVVFIKHEVVEFKEVEELGQTLRGAGGLGHTGR